MEVATIGEDAGFLPAICQIAAMVFLPKSLPTTKPRNSKLEVDSPLFFAAG